MKKLVKNKLRMYEAVKQVLSDNAASWNGLPAFESAYNAFSEKLIQVINIGISEQRETIGTAKEKQKVREELAYCIARLSSVLRVYALDNELLALGEQMKIYRTHLRSKSEVDALQLASYVINACTEHAANLEPYGFTPSDLSSAVNLLAEFESLRTEPRKALIARKQMTRNIAEGIKVLEMLLHDKLDELMFAKQNELVDFFNAYQDARMIVAYQGKRSTRKGGDATPDSGENPPRP